MRRQRMRGRASTLALVLACALLGACAMLAACAGQGIEVKPRGQTVISVGTGSR